MYNNDYDIEDVYGGVFLFHHWTSFMDCPRFVHEPPPYIAVPQNLHGLPMNRDVPDRWLATFMSLPYKAEAEK